MNHHKMFRPNYTGSCMIVWCKGEEYPYSLTKGGGGIPYVEDVMLMDPFNMPPEDTGILPSNMEATMSYYQALRTYAFYKYGVGYPTTACIPGLGFFEPPS
ncbi:MAG: hypothetical protein SVY53_05100 [Chloroflexota bacterium]|nr:hypothetical protein [Chloroflexota bacterium]